MTSGDVANVRRGEPITGVIELLSHLIGRLEEHGIDYCHWKGNFRLDRVLAGEDDFDLLVSAESGPPVEDILRSLGFRAAIPRVEPGNAGSKHFYGYERSADSIVHVHLYTEVLTGENFIDSHRVPFQQMLLGGTDRCHGVRVPSKAAESILLVLKTYIRYGSVLDAMASMRRRRDMSGELTWLNPAAHVDESVSLLMRYCPHIEADLYRQCVRGLTTGTTLLPRQRLARAVRRSLERYERHGVGRRVLEKTLYLTRKVARDMGLRSGGKVLEHGGRVIAVAVQRDAPSQNAPEELARWLGEVFWVRLLDGGVSQPSLDRGVSAARKGMIVILRWPASIPNAAPSETGMTHRALGSSVHVELTQRSETPSPHVLLTVDPDRDEWLRDLKAAAWETLGS